MGLLFHHLADPEVRQRMVGMWRDEFAALKAGYPRQEWPYGRYLIDAGWAAFETAMPQALTEHDDDWLAAQVRDPRYWLPKASRAKPVGGRTWVDYDKEDALRRLATGEFNVAYVHGLASVLLDRGQSHCVVYRAGVAVEPRDAYCTNLEERQAPLAQILADHRRNYFPVRDPDAKPIPSGPNCHHSIRAI
ncbi:MAG TPA: hypothetical protein VES62_07455 [Thermoleophilaceae bacterium]|nr:hypothetical protein [Thermoleophilaceae bacterium]